MHTRARTRIALSGFFEGAKATPDVSAAAACGGSRDLVSARRGPNKRPEVNDDDDDDEDGTARADSDTAVRSAELTSSSVAAVSARLRQLA
jgi:hypothetical protein